MFFMTRARLFLVISVGFLSAHSMTFGQSGEPAVAQLLRLAPADSAVILTLEDLREHARRFADSRLAAIFKDLPAVRAWLESGHRSAFDQVRERVESVLEVKLEDVRDEILGDAVVLAIQIPDQGQGRGHGVLLIKPRDRALFDRLLSKLNSVQQDSGDIERVLARTYAGVVYHAREYPAGAERHADWYVVLPEGVFAVSDDEAMIIATIDRALGQSSDSSPRHDRDPRPEEGGRSRLLALKRLLPAHAAAGILVDPRQIERLIGQGEVPTRPEERHFLDLIRRGLATVDYAGLAVVWNENAMTVRMVESLRRSSLPSWAVRWARSASGNTSLDGPGAGALVSASLHLDASALEEALRSLAPADKTAAIDHLETVASGLMLGQDLRGQILGQLGPRLSLDLLPPAPGLSPARFDLLLSLEVRDSAARDRVLDGFDNALRTVLALWAADLRNNPGGSRLRQERTPAGTITSLDDVGPFAFAIDRRHGRVILSTGKQPLASALGPRSDPAASKRIAGIRQVAVQPGDGSPAVFAVVDLQTVWRVFETNRAGFAAAVARCTGKSAASETADLKAFLQAARAFDALTFYHMIKPDGSQAMQTISLLVSPR